MRNEFGGIVVRSPYAAYSLHLLFSHDKENGLSLQLLFKHYRPLPMASVTMSANLLMTSPTTILEKPRLHSNRRALILGQGSNTHYRFLSLLWLLWS